MSPISSRKIVPRSACSNLPTCFSVAPVKDPFSWPKSSDSISSSGMAAQFTWTKRCPDRGLLRWIVRATSSLPTPLCPSSRTGAFVRLEDAAEPGALSNQLVPGLHRAPQVAIFGRQLRLPQHVPQRDDDAFAAEGFVEEVDRTGLDRLDGGRRRSVAGDHHDG